MKTQQPIYVSHALYRLGKSQNWSTLLAIELATQSAKDGKVLTAQQVQKIKNEGEKNYSNKGNDFERKFDSDFVQLRYELYKGIEKLGFFGSEYLGNYFSKRLEDVYEDSMLNVDYKKNYQQRLLLGNGIDNSRTILNDAFETAQNNEQYKEVLDNVFSEEFRSFLDTTEEQLRAANPDFDEFLIQQNLVDGNNKVISDNTILKKILQDKFNNVIESIEKNGSEVIDKINKIGSSGNEQNEKIDELFNRIDREQYEKDYAAKQQWNEYSTEVSIAFIASLLGDRTAAKNIMTVSDAIVKLKNLFTQFNSMSKVSAFGTIGLLVGSMGIVSGLFRELSKEEGKTTDEIIIETLGKISEQIEQVRLQIMDGLSFIDKKIDTYFEEAQYNARIIINYLRGIDVNVIQAKNALKNISKHVNLIWLDLDLKINYILNSELNDLKSEINDYKSIYGQDKEMTVEEIKSYLKEISTQFNASKDAVFTGDTNSISDIDRLSVALEGNTLSSVINIIRNYITQYSALNLIEKRANKERLSNCIYLIAKLAIDNPVNFKEIPATAFQRIYDEIKMYEEEVQRFRNNESLAFTSIFRNLIEQYKNTILSFKNEVKQIYNQELITFDEIAQKDFAINNIVQVLESYFSIASQGFKLDNFTLVDVFNERALAQLENMSATHEIVEKIKEYFPILEAPTLPLAIDKHEFVKVWKLCGDNTCPPIKLSPAIAQKILEKNPILAVLINFGKFKNKATYFGCFNPFEVYKEGPVAQAIKGLFTICLQFPIEHEDSKLRFEISKILLEDKLQRIICYTVGSPVRYFNIKEELENISNYKESAKNVSPNYYFSKEDTNIDVWNYVYDTVKNYTQIVQNRLRDDLEDSSSNLFKSVRRIECMKNMIGLFVKYAIDENPYLLSENLAYLLGETKTKFSMPELLQGNKFLPLIDGNIISDLIDSYAFPDKEMEVDEFFRNNEIGLQFFDQSFIDKVNESLDILLDEIYGLTKVDFNSVSSEKTILELLIASKS